MRTLLFLSCAFVLVMILARGASAEEDGSSDIGFNEHIRPILSEYCFPCHGPDSGSRKADLRLDRRRDALAAGVIVPGNTAASELIARITSADPEAVMPPPESPRKLELEHRSLLIRWIAAGAKWEEHWAFLPPRRPELPADAARWARNPVDRFVFYRMHQLGLSPNGEADRHTLARRAALDLTGLPPTTDAVESFVSDTGHDAYERYLDTLLASTHAGEHRARYWLDAARYGDTHCMHVDNYREIWPYRDWVVRAFNSNMPFDQFVIRQIAGDLLPDATIDERIATGFNRCHVTTAEAGSIPEEVNLRYTGDRVETTATVFLGLTLGCAACHHHKFDPITQREFYQLGAFFNNTTQLAMDGNQKDTPPVVALPGTDFVEEWTRMETQRRKLRNELGQWTTAGDWWPRRPPTREHPVDSDGLILWMPLTEGEGEPLQIPESARWATGHPAGRRGIRFGDGDGEGLSVDLPRLRTDEPFSVSFWFRPPDRLATTPVFEQVETTKNDDGKEEPTLGWKIVHHFSGGLIVDLYDGERLVRNFLAEEDPLRPRTWQHVCVRYSGGQSNSAISVLLDGRPGQLRKADEQYAQAVALAEVPLRIAGQSSTAGLSDVRIFRRWLSDEEVQLLAQENALRELLRSDVAWSDLEPQDRAHLIKFHNNVVDDDYRNRSRRLAASERRRDFIYSRSTTTLVMHERSSLPRAWVRERGEYNKRREEVSPDVPSVLPPFPKEAPRNRLGLARWLVQRDHPLTARVTVNRLWQSVFGVGLVKTSEDFGVMGERPSHPQLLDWLAVEFVESGWSVKHILKLIVTSATYRQSAVVTLEKLEKDPGNRLLARGPRVRLDAEVLRDQALAVSGLLTRRMEGPSVRPYQPPGLWKVVAIDHSNTSEFKQDSGDALYRRSLYTFWKRTSPPPSMAAFNAPTREQCTVRRERTNTPLQALVLMNDPQFVEAARHLAQNALARYAADRARASWMLTTVLARPASDADLRDVLSGMKGFRDIFTQEPNAATALIQAGDSVPDATWDPIELAAWTLVANTLMNRDDFINKD